METSVTEADGVAKATTSASWLTRHEWDLERRLRDSRVSFVAEIATDAAAIQRSQHEYGFLAGQMGRQRIDRTRLVTWYPALTLVLLVDSAARCESLENFWSQYFADLGCPADPEFSDVLKSVTPDLLRDFGLLDITELDADFSAILAGQAAIPTLHTTELVELAERYLEMGPITDEYHFAQWLAEFDAAGRSEPDRTVQRFARYGGRLASDVLDGVVDLVSGSSRTAAGAPSTAGLPAALQRSLHDLLARRHPRRAGRADTATPVAPAATDTDVHPISQAPIPRRPIAPMPAGPRASRPVPGAQDPSPASRAHGQPIGRHRPQSAVRPTGVDRIMPPPERSGVRPLTSAPDFAGGRAPAHPVPSHPAAPGIAGRPAQPVPDRTAYPASGRTAPPVPTRSARPAAAGAAAPPQLGYPTEIAPVTDPFRGEDAPPTVLLNIPLPDGLVDPWNPLDATSEFTGSFPAIALPAEASEDAEDFRTRR